MRVARLDGRIEPTQGVAVRAGQLRLPQRVQDRLVVLVHQHRCPLPAALVQRLDQVGEAFRPGGVRWGADARAPFHPVQLRRQVQVEVAGLGEVPSAEVEAHDRMAHRPVPAVVDGEASKQRLVALEQLLQRVHEQALAETPRARQEVVLAPVHQPLGVGRLVHVVAALLPDLAEGLDPDGQLALGHGAHRSPRLRDDQGRTGRRRCRDGLPPIRPDRRGRPSAGSAACNPQGSKAAERIERMSPAEVDVVRTFSRCGIGSRGRTRFGRIRAARRSRQERWASMSGRESVSDGPVDVGEGEGSPGRCS